MAKFREISSIEHGLAENIKNLREAYENTREPKEVYMKCKKG